MLQQSALLLLLVNPSFLGALPGDNLLLVEPQSNLLLSTLNAVRAVADITANIDSIVKADSTWCGSKWVGGTEDETASLDDFTTFPNHGSDWTRGHVCFVKKRRVLAIHMSRVRRKRKRRTADETWEEWLCLQVFIVLLQVSLAGRDDLDGDELEATLLEAGDNVTNETTLELSVRNLFCFKF
jgi:hypothetical protein